MIGRFVDAQHPDLGSVWIIEDMSERKRQDELLQSALTEQKMIFDNAAFGIVYVSGAHLQRCNDRFADMLGFDSGETIGRFVREIFPERPPTPSMPQRRKPACVAMAASWAKVQLQRRDGSLFWSVRPRSASAGIRAAARSGWSKTSPSAAWRRKRCCAPMTNWRRVAARTAELETANVQLQSEIFERMQAEKRIWHIAHHDALTGLPNRALLQDRLDQALIAAERNRNHVAVLFLDLDRFKNVNDSLGHDVGDALLQIVADRLVAVVRDIDTVCRLGGDEFVIIAQCGQRAGRRRTHLRTHHRGAGAAGRCDGPCPARIHLDRYRLLSRRRERRTDADEERRCRDVCREEPWPQQLPVLLGRPQCRGPSFFQLEQKLRHAVGNRELVLYYQPQVDTSAHRVCALEALVPLAEPEVRPGAAGRVHSPWPRNRAHRRAGRMGPARGLPAVAQMARGRLAARAGRGQPSARQFQQRDLVARIRNILDETGPVARHARNSRSPNRA